MRSTSTATASCSSPRATPTPCTRSTAARGDRLAARRPPQRLRDGPGASFAWQHDRAARPTHADGFRQRGLAACRPQSRAIVLEVDEQRRTARLKRQFLHRRRSSPRVWAACSCCPTQRLRRLGAEPFVSEFSPSGELLFDARSATATRATARSGPWRANARANRRSWRRAGRPLDQSLGQLERRHRGGALAGARGARPDALKP